MTFSNRSMPTPPAHLVIFAVGVGKSHAAREQVKELLRCVPDNMCIVIASPTHALNDEHAERLLGLFMLEGFDVAVYRGRNAIDPNRPGHRMCDFADEAAELNAAGGDVDQLCCVKENAKNNRCKYFDVCGYRRQKDLNVRVWIIPHSLLTKPKPKCIATVYATIIDEDPTLSHLRGFDSPYRITIDELREIRHVPLKSRSRKIDNDKTADLRATSDLLINALSTIQEKNTPLTCEALTNAGLTAEVLRSARKAIYLTKRPVDVSPSMDDEKRTQTIRDAKRHNGPIFRLARFFKLLADALDTDGRIVSGCRFERGIRGQNGEQYDAVRLYLYEPLHDSWRAPTIITSATADPVLLDKVWPGVEHVASVNPETPHMTTRQILWSASQTKLKLEGNLLRLKHYIELRAFEYRGRGAEVAGRTVDVLIIAQKKTEDALIALGLPENVDIGHFNAIEGIDKWRHVACVIVIGRTMPSPADVELMAEVIASQVIERNDEFENGWYPRNYAGIRLRNAEYGYPTRSEAHPNEVAEAVRWNISEGGIIQAIGRGRGVNRTAADPLQVDIIGTLPLPLEVDEVLTWEEAQAHPYAVMAARGLIVSETAVKGKWPLVASVLADLFNTPDAARKALKRTSANKEYILADVRLRRFIPAIAKRQGDRYAVPVLVDAQRGTPRQLAEKLLGPLNTFDVSCDDIERSGDLVSQ